MNKILSGVQLPCYPIFSDRHYLIAEINTGYLKALVKTANDLVGAYPLASLTNYTDKVTFSTSSGLPFSHVTVISTCKCFAYI